MNKVIVAELKKRLGEAKGDWVDELPDNAVVDAFKLILLIYNNFSIVKKVVNKIVRVK